MFSHYKLCSVEKCVSVPYFVSLIFVEALCGVHSPGSVQAAKLDILGDSWRLVHDPLSRGFGCVGEVWWWAWVGLAERW